MENTQAVKPKNVFTNKNFVLAFLGALVSNTGNLLYSFAVSFYILLLTNNNAFIQGLYLAVGGITYTLVVLFGGVISDRFHKGKIMSICDYVKGFAIVLMTILLMTVITTNNGKIIALFIMAVIANIIAGIFSPASASLLPHIVPEESFQQAQSYYALLSSVQGILGIVLAGILYTLLPINTLFLIVGGCYILSGVSEMFIRYQHEKKEDKLTLKSSLKDIGSAFKYLSSMKPLFYFIICVLFINFFITPDMSNALPYFVATDVTNSDYLFKNIMEPEMWVSILQVATSIGSIIVAIILSNRPKKEKIIKDQRISFCIVSEVMISVPVLYMLYYYNILNINVILISYIVLFIIIGGAIVSINIPFGATVLTIVDKEQLGKVNSLMDVGAQGLIPLSNLLAGIAISSLGLGFTMGICAAGFLVITIIILFNKEIGKL